MKIIPKVRHLMCTICGKPIYKPPDGGWIHEDGTESCQAS